MPALNAEWRNWRRQRGDGPTEDFTLGSLLPALLSELRRIHGEPESTTVTITRRELAHAQRPDKAITRDQALDSADIDRLPEAIHRPDAVVFDRRDRTLIYAFTPAKRRGRVAKAVVRIDYRQKVRRSGRRQMVTSNAVRTSGYVALGDLRNPRYELLLGRLG